MLRVCVDIFYVILKSSHFLESVILFKEIFKIVNVSSKKPHDNHLSRAQVNQVMLLFVWKCSLLDSGLVGFIFIFDMNRTSTQRQKLWDSYPPLIYSMLIASLLAHSWLAISDMVFSGLAQYWVRVKGKLWVSLSNSSISLELCYENIVIITNWQILVKITMFKALNRSLSTNIVGFILQRHIILVFFSFKSVGWSFGALGQTFLVYEMKPISSYTENDD